MPAYFVAIRNKVNDPAEMEIYGAKARQTMAGHSLKPLTIYGKIRSTDGPTADGVVILEFPTFEEAEAWYDGPAYQDAMTHRLKGADFQTFIVEGL
jgi:uncharacterized protein (DUF1330 family)